MRYRTIVADPPWMLREGGAGPNKGVVGQYEQMTLGEVTLLDVERLAAPDCTLWLWVPSLNLMQGDPYLVLSAWRFIPKALHTWIKPGLGVGWFGRSNTEHVIVATRGHPTVRFQAIPTAHAWPRAGHSCKPEQFFDLVEQTCDGPYVELFARNHHRLGWDVWGNQSANTAMLQSSA